MTDMQFPTLHITEDTPTNETLAALVPFPHPQQHPDVIWVAPLEGKTSLTIEQVHSLTAQLQYKPVQVAYKIAFILEAHALTLPAQQALLKTLEEPPENTQLILCTPLPNLLLPTIRSRITHIVTAPNHPSTSPKTEGIYPTLQTQTVSACLHLSDTWSTSKEIAMEHVRSLLVEIRIAAREHASPKTLRDARATLLCLDQLSKNVHQKLALDHLFFTLKGETL